MRRDRRLTHLIRSLTRPRTRRPPHLTRRQTHGVRSLTRPQTRGFPGMTRPRTRPPPLRTRLRTPEVRGLARPRTRLARSPQRLIRWRRKEPGGRRVPETPPVVRRRRPRRSSGSRACPAHLRALRASRRRPGVTRHCPLRQSRHGARADQHRRRPLRRLNRSPRHRCGTRPVPPPRRPRLGAGHPRQLPPRLPGDRLRQRRSRRRPPGVSRPQVR